MQVNTDRDFTGFDNLSPREKLNMIYRLLCHIETEQDVIKKQLWPDGYTGK